MRIITFKFSKDSAKRMNLKLYSFATTLCCIAALFFSTTTLGQLVANSNLNCASGHCTSKDLAVVDVFVDAPPCASCSGTSVTYPLKMTIHNGTKSVRTSFALYGTLSSGASINGVSGNVFICVGPITVKSSDNIGFGLGNQTFTVGNITFSCGQNLTLTNNFLAWTDASGTTSDRCNTFSQATKCSDIEPKCGTAASITIRQPLSAQSSANQSCDNSATGSLTVTPNGGQSPYNITIDGTTFNHVTTATKNPLGGGTYNYSCTDAAGCTFNGTQNVPTIQCCVAPPKPTVCETPASLCGDGTASLTVSNAVVGDVYHLKQNGVEVSSSPQTATSSTVTFTGLTPGAGFDVWGVESKNGTTCEGTHAGCGDLSGTCQSSSSTLTQKVTTSSIEVNSVAPTVKAYPNPFNDRVKFVINSPASGDGSLEVYNIMGQKVKTVYQGHINTGDNSFELTIPKKQQATLIYMFRVGDKKVTGKLLQLNN